MALSDPNLPAGAIVKELENGGAIRNDGVKLRPASENVWYRILTAYGEQEPGAFDKELHEKNRRIWNGWACGHLDEAERVALAEKAGLHVEELAPLNAEEQRKLEKACGGAEAVPKSSDDVDFSKTHFRNPIGFLKCVVASSWADFSTAHFASWADFSTAHFASWAYFSTAYFASEADFSTAHFASWADFRTAHFASWANFRTAHFASWADFSTAHFASWANFRTAHFASEAYFSTAHFASWANFRTAHFASWANFSTAEFRNSSDFRGGAFEGPLDFRSARFAGPDARSPLFHNCKMHGDTRFTLDTTLWPTPTDDNAEDEKEAFTRLRQIMVELHKPDDQHFFLRREMAAKALMGPWYDRWITKGYGLIADYGWSMLRPVVGLAALWVVGWLLMLMQFQWHCVMGGGVCKSGAFAAGLSFANLFSFLGFGRLYFGDFFRDDPSTFVILISAAQNILGVIFLFFFGLGLRNRFRLK